MSDKPGGMGLYRCNLPEQSGSRRVAGREIERLKAEVERLNKMRVHCQDCGSDYLATGMETGCPCKLITENARLREELAALERVKQ